MCISNKFPGDTHVAGPGTTFSESRARNPNGDPESQDHVFFLLPTTAPRVHRTSVYILKTGFLERTSTVAQRNRMEARVKMSNRLHPCSPRNNTYELRESKLTHSP